MSGSRGPGSTPVEERLVGAQVVHVEQRHGGDRRLVVVFEHRGTDNDSGYLLVPLAGVYFSDGGDPDEWKALTVTGTRATPGSDLAAIRAVLDLPPGERRAAIDYLDRRARADDDTGREAAEAVGHFLRWGSRYGRTR